MDLFRTAALGYAVVLHAIAHNEYRRPWAAWAVLAVLAAWTAFLWVRRSRTAGLLVCDLALASAAVVATRFTDDWDRIAAGAPTLPSIYPAAAVVSWAIWRGWRGGLAAALVIAAADVAELFGVAGVTAQTVNNVVLLVLAGLIVGYGVELIRAGRAELAAAVAVRAANQERERLARDIHDSVLQVLGYVQRRGGGLDGEAAELARLAGEQEARLRALVATGPVHVGAGGDADLRAALSAYAGSGVTVSGPGEPVLLPAATVAEIAAATAAALDNVGRHAGAGAKAWVLVEDEGDAVTVTVRDDGVGIASGRLAAAVREGRLGVASSICGRIGQLGGKAAVTGTAGEGTEVEMRVPR